MLILMKFQVIRNKKLTQSAFCDPRWCNLRSRVHSKKNWSPWKTKWFQSIFKNCEFQILSDRNYFFSSNLKNCLDKFYKLVFGVSFLKFENVKRINARNEEKALSHLGKIKVWLLCISISKRFSFLVNHITRFLHGHAHAANAFPSLYL